MRTFLLAPALATALVPVAARAAEPAQPTPAPIVPAKTPNPKKADARPEDKPAEPRKDAEPPAWETAPAEHRGGFTVGLAAAAGLGASNGFPNDSKKIGRARFYTESGLGFAPSSSLWMGGALADWLTFGVGGGFSTILAEGSRSPAPLAFFHGDVYPFSPFGGHWRNLGGMVELGLGFPTTVSTDTDEELIDGSGSSYVFAGAFWEGIEVWKIKMGPYTGVHYMFSNTVRRPIAALGFRISIYAAP